MSTKKKKIKISLYIQKKKRAKAKTEQQRGEKKKTMEMILWIERIFLTHCSLFLIIFWNESNKWKKNL